MELLFTAHHLSVWLWTAGFRPFIVGGAVRDHFMGLEPKDFDIVVWDCPDMETLISLLGTNFKVDAVGKQFGVLKVVVEGETLDVALPRRDSKTGVGHTGFNVVVDPSMTLTEEMARRDFTVNAMAFDPIKLEFHDPFNGLADIESRTLRHTSMAFAEDPLRVMRGVQFAARFEMDMALSTQLLCRSLKGSFKEIAVERLWEEWIKIFTKGKSFVKAQIALSQCGWAEFYPGLWDIRSHGIDTLIQRCRTQGLTDEKTIISVLASIQRQAPETFEAVNPLDKAIRRDATKLATAVSGSQLLGFDKADCALMARRLAPLTFRDLARLETEETFEFALGHVVLTAFENDVLDGPLRLFVTGADLIERDLPPSPLFKVILEHFTGRRDRFVDKTREEALAELDTICKELVGSPV